MKRLPNGLTVYNATPHSIRFWGEDWPEPIEVEPDEVVNARPVEEPAGCLTRQDLGLADDDDYPVVSFVTTKFVGDEAGHKIIALAHEDGACVIVGSIIAAQAYPGEVMAMTPSPGYERVPPAEKRMNPDKFTLFEKQDERKYTIGWEAMVYERHTLKPIGSVGIHPEREKAQRAALGKARQVYGTPDNWLYGAVPLIMPYEGMEEYEPLSREELLAKALRDMFSIQENNVTALAKAVYEALLP